MAFKEATERDRVCRRTTPDILRLRTLAGIEGLIHGFSTRRSPAQGAGEFNMSFTTADAGAEVTRNRRAFFGALGIPPARVVFMRQPHSDHVALVTRADAGRGAASPETAIPDTDAMLSQDKGIFLAALGADCALTVLCDEKAGVVGIVHAGWRGTVSGIAAKTVRRMKADLGCIPAHIVAGIGPAIGPCCYEVGRDVVEAARAGFGGEAVLRRGDRSYFDIRRANVRQLLAEGVRRESIEVADICTSCAHDRFFSYRRDGAAGGRLCGVVGFVR